MYFPNIFTYLHGEESELFGNFDTFSVKSNLNYFSTIIIMLNYELLNLNFKN